MANLEDLAAGAAGCGKRTSLNQLLGRLSPSHLKDYMQNLKGSMKQRTFSSTTNNEQVIFKLGGTSLESEKVQQVHPIVVMATDVSHMHSKRSETSHDVWNAGQSSY